MVFDSRVGFLSVMYYFDLQKYEFPFDDLESDDIPHAEWAIHHGFLVLDAERNMVLTSKGKNWLDANHPGEVLKARANALLHEGRPLTDEEVDEISGILHITVSGEGKP